MAAKVKEEFVFVLSLTLLVMAVVVLTSPHSGQLLDADSRTEATLKGLFNYYWKNDPNNKKIQFLFACGQLGQMGTTNQGQCSCSTPTSCINCYRWWTAIMMESLATYGIHMNSSNHSSVPSVIYAHSPYNGDWNATATCTYVDDFLWYGIAYLRVYDWLSVSSFVLISVYQPYLRRGGGYFPMANYLACSLG